MGSTHGPGAACLRFLRRKPNVKGELVRGPLRLYPLRRLPGDGWIDLATSRRQRHRRAEGLGLMDFKRHGGTPKAR
jgi:hypothetical protein